MRKATILRKGDKILVDKGIVGKDFGVFLSTEGWSIGGWNGFYKSDKDGKEHIFDQTVHVITKVRSS